jgi:hypothetical protein
VKLHPREERTRTAANELATFLVNLVKKHGLTEGEALRVVSGELGAWVGDVAKWMIRGERHPDDPDQPGGLA